LPTRVCDRLGVRHPIVNAPMGGGDAPGALAAAVSAAGGLGMIGGTTAGDVDWLIAQIRTARRRTDQPIGVGFLSQWPNAHRLMEAALGEGIRVVAHSFADPAPFVPRAHRAGAVVLGQVRTVAEARHAVDAGVDLVVAQGTEAGGHTGRVPTLALVPAVVDAVAPVPVIAAGGIGDGRTLAAVFVLGAEAAWIGTRFLATHESGVSDVHKEAVVAASADDTVLTHVYDIVMATDWPDDVAGRVIRDRFVDRWHDHADELRELVRDGANTPFDPDRGPAMWAGPAAAFVTAREPAAAVVESLVAEASRRLAGFADQ
jgi:nitronate monooxygenase